MFVKNRSSFKPRLARGYLTDTRAALSLNVELVLERRHGVWSRSDARLPDPRPPGIARRILWKNVSLTVAGIVAARSGQRSAVVRLNSPYGGADLRVFGVRRWVNRRGALVASEPEPLGDTSLSWRLAFGGTDTVEPGYFPGTELPHPGGPAVYSLNPAGIGFYISQAQAVGRPPLILACVLAVVAVAGGRYVQALVAVVIGAVFTGGYFLVLTRTLRKAGTGRDLHDAWTFAGRYGKRHLSAREQTEAHRILTGATGDELSLAREDRQWRRAAVGRSARYARFVAVVLFLGVGTCFAVGIAAIARFFSGGGRLIDAVAPIVIGAAFVAACLLIEHSRAVRFAVFRRVASALEGAAHRGVAAATKRLDWLDAAGWGDTDAEFAGHPWDTLLVAEGHLGGVRVMLVMTKATGSRARRTDVYLAAPGSWHPDASNFLGEAGWSFRPELGGGRLTRNDLSIDAIDPARLLPLIRRVLSSRTPESENVPGGPP